CGVTFASVGRPAPNPAQDLTSGPHPAVKLGGAPVPLIRQYDSLSTSQSGTFGFGWRLANTDTSIQINVAATGLEDRGIYNPLSIGSRLYLTLPDGTRAGFTFAPVAHEESGVTFYTPPWHDATGIGYT